LAVTALGAPEAGKTALLESGAAALQSRPPIEAINTYLDGFHYYCGNQQGQMEAHHYVTILNDDVMQAVIFYGNKKNAKIMGGGNIINGRLF